MITQCIWCHKRPVKIKKHLLCAACYQYKRVNGSLRTIKDPKKKLIKRYGKDLMDDLDMLKRNPAWTLKKVGDRHGVTREYIRQIYRTVFGRSYTVDKLKKSKLYHEDTVCSTNPLVKVATYSKKKRSGYFKNAQKELEFLKKCESLGYKVQFKKGWQVGMLVNGHNVIVRVGNTSRKLHPGSKTKYCTFRIQSRQKADADFIACYHGPLKKFFIIPVKEFNFDTIYIGEKPSTYQTAKNRYQKYEEAWNLLKES